MLKPVAATVAAFTNAMLSKQENLKNKIFLMTNFVCGTELVCDGHLMPIGPPPKQLQKSDYSNLASAPKWTLTIPDKLPIVKEAIC